ncbi:MAG: glycoside hydrolase family 2 protein [Sphaerochaeta sp.]
MNIPLSEYPRPQMRRESYLCLNGRWELTFLSDGEKAERIPVMVPYSPESDFSGVGRTLQAHETMLYSRHVDFPDSDISESRLLLHFGAVDYRAIVFIDKKPVFEHIGGYLPFTVEVDRTSFDLDVSVQDPGDAKEISRGKQSSEPGGIWYPKASGIWQTVWMEKVPKVYIKNIELKPALNGFGICVHTNEETPGDCELHIQNKTFNIGTNRDAFIEIEEPKLWTPENPVLYDFELKAGMDSVKSYVGLRTFGTGFDENGNKVLFLNEKPYFHHGLLDQGYYKGGFYTPMSDADFVNDILLMKKMGFNTLRKHIKIEPLRWYYHCDRLGMLVWQDMVSGGGHYDIKVISFPLVLGSFLKDNNEKAYVKFARADKDERKQWEKETEETVMHLFNCICIAMWVPFNEGWGQFDSKRICEKIKALDSSRTIDPVSGWHDQGSGDFKSLHVYFRPYHFKRDKLGRAVLLSEFGGYGMDMNTTAKKAFTYRRFRDRDSLTRAIVKLYEKQIMTAKRKGLAASIYTQVSDVEQEVNGLISYDRKSVKVNTEEMTAMSKKLLS